MKKSNFLSMLNMCAKTKSETVSFTEGGAFARGFEAQLFIPQDFGFVGVYSNSKLQQALKSLPDGELAIKNKEDSISFSIGKSKSGVSNISSETENFSTPYYTVIDIPDGFVDVLSKASKIASDSLDSFNLACVHITENFTESCDSTRLYRGNIGLNGIDLCLHKSSVLFISEFNPTEYAVIEQNEKKHVLFKNSDGCILQCACYVVNYMNLNNTLLVDSSIDIKLPSEILDVLKRSSVVTANNSISVDVGKDNVTVRGENMGVWFEESVEVVYDGDPIKFTANPNILYSFFNENMEAKISTKGSFKRLSILNKNEIYMLALGK